MYFQSAGFLFIFLPLFLTLTIFAPAGKLRLLLLLVFSYLFYSGGEPFFILLLIISTLADFTIALQLDTKSKKYIRGLWLSASVLINLGLLGYFKYGALMFPYFRPLGVMLHMPMPDPDFYKTFILPAGISFYTFQTMSYTIDVYRGQTKPTKDLLAFACYVAYLPQLVAGPIERFHALAPQIQALANKRLHPNWNKGLNRLSLGIIQKLFIADSCGRIVDTLMQYRGLHSFVSSWTIAISFGLQIYYDFAAYTSMAIGISLLLGIRLSENFKSPYRSSNIREFWRRWHITLSNWLRDYLYIPLGGSRKGTRRTVLNIMLTFLFCGLWHGAGGTFRTPMPLPVDTLQNT